LAAPTTAPRHFPSGTHNKDRCAKEEAMEDNFGDRMKAYEAVESERRFIPLLPVYARIDGRSFSAFTRGMERPFDIRMYECMLQATEYLVENTQARIGYTQSDEINLVWLAEEYESDIFFAGKIHKIVSVLASMAAARFAGLTARLLGGPYTE